MNTFQTILLGGLPFIALLVFAVVFYLHKAEYFDEVTQYKEHQSNRGKGAGVK